jgi:hypothetical protein
MCHWPELVLPPINLWNAPKQNGMSQARSAFQPAHFRPDLARRSNVAPITREIQRLMQTR